VTDPHDTPLDARAYDAWFDHGWGAYAFEIERATLRNALGELAGLRVVDVGCGTGRFTADLEDAGADLVAIDRDYAMLELARQRVDGTILHGDATALPLDDDTVDAPVAMTLLEFSDAAEDIVSELVRVTRPGGRVALNPRSPWGLARRRELRRPPWIGACLRTPAELRALLADYGPVRTWAALYAPGAIPGLLRRLGPLLERIGRPFPDLGAFQVTLLSVPEAGHPRQRSPRAG